jgi:hypothetical protein
MPLDYRIILSFLAFFSGACGGGIPGDPGGGNENVDSNCIEVQGIPICQCNTVSILDLPSCVERAQTEYYKNCCACIIDNNCYDDSQDVCVDSLTDGAIWVESECMQDNCNDYCSHLQEV